MSGSRWVCPDGSNEALTRGQVVGAVEDFGGTHEPHLHGRVDPVPVESLGGSPTQ
jgi:hypothetical protein